jgi:hypothetical protein
MAKWEIIEEMVKQLPQSKQDRAYKFFCTFVEELEILYPGSNESMRVLWPLFPKRIMQIPELQENGYGSEVFLDNSYYEDLKNI